MEKYCQNPLCENEAVKQVPVSVREASDQKRSLCAACEEAYSWGVQQGQLSRKGLLIEPPPKEKGTEALYRAVYVIDANGPDPQQAAERAYEIMKDPQSMKPVLHIVDGKGSVTIVDLAACDTQAKPDSDEPQEKARRFVLAGGTRCPVCESEDIDFGRLDVDAEYAYQEACCCHCESKFCAVYRPVGYGLYVGDSLEFHTLADDFGKIEDETG